MRYILLVSALMLLVASAAFAGEDPRGPDRRAHLEHELRVARLEADMRKALNTQLLALIDDLFARMGERPAAEPAGGDAHESRVRSLAAQNDELRSALQAEQKRHARDVVQLQHELMSTQQKLEEQRLLAAQAERKSAHIPALKEAIHQLRVNLGAEQERHAADVSQLQQELAKAHQRAEKERMAATRTAQQTAMLEREMSKAQAQIQAHRVHALNAAAKAKSEALRAVELSKEMDRLKWNFVKGAPSDSVAARLGDVPAAHWRQELTSNDALRARVALAVLSVVTDPSPEAVSSILHAASHHRELLDRATRTLLRVGAPAAAKLVDVARSEQVPTAWAAHVLGEMGGDAKDALPWLAEVAEDEGRDGDAARRAIQRIRGDAADPR